MKTSDFINRRSFLKLVLMAGSGLFITLWYSIALKNRRLTSKPSEVRIDLGKLGTGVYFHDDFILYKAGILTRVYSNKCTHAGCRINRESAGELVCPCHGSKFETATGRVLKGPARLPLKTLAHRLDPGTGITIIKL